ncbi:hypothetical protein Tco_0400141 [Tanacetum coccineum]
MLVIRDLVKRRKVFRESKKMVKIRAKRLCFSPENLLPNTCNNDKNLSEIQLDHKKEDELVVVVVKVVHECTALMGLDGVCKGESKMGLLEEIGEGLVGGLRQTWIGKWLSDNGEEVGDGD